MYIGDFSKITNLSIRTLRYYNDIGILVPKTDTNSNYRIYNEENIKEAKFIKDLKNAGFSLEEIKELNNRITDEKLQAKEKELYNKIFCIEEQIKQVNNLRQSPKVMIKK